MRFVQCSALCLSVVVLGCGKPDGTRDSAAGAVANTPAPTPPPAPAPIALSALAGKWEVRGTPTEGPDSSSTVYIVTATADTTGWTTMQTGRTPVPMHVRADGDSIITWSGPYDSYRRKGVKVTTNGVYRLQDGKLVGTTVAHYQVKGADSVLHVSMVGTRIP